MHPIIESINPSTGEVIWQGECDDKDEVSSQVVLAYAARHEWVATAIETRIEILQKFAVLLKNSDLSTALKQAIIDETGKPPWEAQTEIDAMAGKVGHSINAHRERRFSVERTAGNATVRIDYRPCGVMAVLGPFNFPGHLPNGHIVPALLAGNTVVFKPSEFTPVVAFRTKEIWEAAGLPDNVLRIVIGGRETGATLVTDGCIDGVLFTGSLAGGRAIARALADRPGVITALEMGGNNPLMVHDCADVRAAVYWTIQSAYITAGQRCSCARRLIVPTGPAGDSFIEALAAAIGRIVIGPPMMNPQPFCGPLINTIAARRVLHEQDELLRAGAGALVKAQPIGPTEAFLSPGLIDVTSLPDRGGDEECFGPLLKIIRTPDIDSSLAECNNTRYGLCAGLLSDDAALWQRFHTHVRAGIVNWNRPTTGATGDLPFGGAKDSGNHRPSAYFAGDYCSWPVSSTAASRLEIPAPAALTPGFQP